MTGFSKVIVDDNEFDKVIKDYKKIKKYMKSSFYEIKKIDGSEKVVSELLKNYYKET